MSPLTIDFWRDSDKPWLRKAIKRFFESGIERGGDVLPSEKNIEIYLELGFAGVDRGDPCLLACFGGIRAGFVLWAGNPDSQIEQKWKTINAIGSYTDPIFRSYGIADALRLEAQDIAREKGYERIYGPVHTTNEKGIQVFEEHYGARICVVEFEKFINTGES